MELRVQKADRIDGIVKAPPSKSYTHRAFIMSFLADGYTVLTGDESLRTRPMQDLLNALSPLGVSAFSTRNNGKPPIIVKGGFNGGETIINGNVSSQFISSILMAAPYSENPVDLYVKGDFISKPYVDMTIDLMKKYKVLVDYERDEKSFHINSQHYRSTDYTVEGDYSSASYLIAAAASLNSDLTIQNLTNDSKQGDKLILDIVRDMGSEVKVKDDEVKINGHGKLDGIEVNLKNAPDLLPTVAVLGAMAKGTTKITGVEHARFKETDRIHTCAIELGKLGVKLTEEEL